MRGHKPNERLFEAIDQMETTGCGSGHGRERAGSHLPTSDLGVTIPKTKLTREEQTKEAREANSSRERVCCAGASGVAVRTHGAMQKRWKIDAQLTGKFLHAH